ncbi:MAG: RNA methyltransferase [Marinilabiliaceae bacterium]|nr:RNA methyltransferase [Marinilabiliaceae bacterium]
MLSKNKQKLITSLAKKKYRDSHHLFIAEGDKLVTDLISNHLSCTLIVCTEQWHNNCHQELTQCQEVIITDESQLKKVSQLKSPPPVIGIFEQKKNTSTSIPLDEQLVLFLDEVQDPGNLGTIIRLADWFGIHHVVCSKDCADVYNHKTIQSTMGAIARVTIHYIDPIEFFELAKKTEIPVYGTFLEGENIYSESLTNTGILVMGNEGKGIGPAIAPYVSKKLFIPNYPAGADTSESLNVSIATAIVCAEFRRRSLASS